MTSQPRILTDNQKLFLSVLFDEAGGDLKKAKELAGYSPETRVSEVTRSIRDEIIELSKQMLAVNSVKAAKAIIETIDLDSDVEPGTLARAKARKEAAESILDRVGVGKKDTLDVNASGVGNIFILPSKNKT